MKYFIVLLLAMIASPSAAQITLEHTYSFRTIRYELVDSGEIKYFQFKGDTLTIFNGDHSLYKTVILPKFGDVQYYTKVNFLSRHLFDLDGKLEFLAETNPRNVAVINEDGTIVFQCDNCS
ncbi:MAG: hypothetical protein ABI778_10215, partial [Ignavibacteriota bacterium]